MSEYLTAREAANIKAQLASKISDEIPEQVQKFLEDARHWNNKMCEFKGELRERRTFLRQRVKELSREIDAIDGAVMDINNFLQDGGNDGEVSEDPGPR